MKHEISKLDLAPSAASLNPEWGVGGVKANIYRLLTTDSKNSGLAVQRVILALVIFPHGAQKMLGWFGGYGFSATMDYFTGTLHLPWVLAFLVIIGEFVGPILLALGLATRVAAFGITAIMVGAILTTHLHVGFFMNWFGSQQGEGFEYHLLALALSVPLLVWGGGRASADGVLEARHNES